MLTQDPGKKKLYKFLLDIVAILAIITFINVFFKIFKIEIPVLSKIGLSFIIGFIFFLLMFKLTRLAKKWGWIILESLVILGPIIGSIVLYTYSKQVFGNILNIISGSASVPEMPQGLLILGYVGTILFLIGLLSTIIFYFKFHRKYLSGEKTLYELGVEEAANEQQFIQQWQEKEKGQNKIGWIIVISLILILAGVLLYMQFG